MTIEQEDAMPVAIKAKDTAAKTSPNSPLAHLLWFGVAGLFVTILALSYGIDLSPGLF